jgi:hypothetical protein
MSFDLILEHLDTDVGRTPLREVPMLAKLTRQLYERPRYLADQPIEADLETWKKAREEMVAINKARGFPLASAAIDRVNFLLRGVPVVIKDEA